MHAKAVTDDQSNEDLDVSVDYIFVYPVEPPYRPGDWMRVVDEVAWTVAFGDWQGADSSFTPWVITTKVAKISGAGCVTTDGYEQPDYPNGAVPGATPSVTPSGKPIDPYVAGQPRTAACGATTGT